MLMGLFTDIGTMDSLLIIFGMWATYSITGSIVFLVLGTPYEFDNEWYYILVREVLRVVVGAVTGFVIVHLSITLT